MVWLGGSWDYNQMLVTVSERHTDQAHVSAVAQAVAEKIEGSGRDVYQTLIYMPGRHWAGDIYQAVTIILGILGVLAVFLSAFLVINTVLALLGQHVRQIGVMKAIGGRAFQIVSMYVGQVLVFGMLAFLAAVLLSAYVSHQVNVGLGGYLNYQPGPFRIPWGPAFLQAAIALVSPVAAALAPVLSGTRITVREAVSDYGLGRGRFGKGLIDRLLERIRFLSRPLALSLRNAFRRKARLALTLMTLMLGGAIFIAVFNLWAAMGVALEDTIDFLHSDVTVSLSHPYRLQKLDPLVMSVPGAASFEGWGASGAQLLADDGETAIEITLLAPPADSTQVEPVMVSGRWLLPGDENAIVIGNHLLKERPDLAVGDEVTIKVKERESTWRVVGIYKMAGNIVPPIVFANYERLNGVRNETDMVSELHVATFPQDAVTQRLVARALETRFDQVGIPVAQVQTKVEFTSQQAASIDVLAYFLLVMAVLIALVGGLGLTGMMSMNVLERTREIGVMRAVGASSGAILRIVIAEGMLVGIISWVLAAPLSIPITLMLNQGVGTAIFTVPMDFYFNWQGLALWLVGVLALGALASAVPAWSAARLTIRQVLAYE
jgi:putative ABC transport system permease protein